jgi:hypothetical protein
MVHIYHLHIQTEVTAQRQSILICMDALERVSGIWLVGKMVHDLFESILAIDGFDRYLKENPSQSPNRPLPYNKSSPKKVEFIDGSTPDLQPPEKGIKSLSLTPSLIAHMDAALKSAASPNKPSSNGRTSKGSAHGDHGHGQNGRPLAPRVKDSENQFLPE